MKVGRRVRRRAGAMAALAGALLAVGPAPPAGAEPVITVTNPPEGATLDSAAVAVSGRVQPGAVLATVKDVTLEVGGASFKAPCTTSPCNFAWTPSLPANGRYELKVSATEALIGSSSSTLSRNFVVDAPPAKPVLDAPRITEGRTVELSWSRNTEPDMLYYAVFRKDPAGSTFLPVGKVDQPPTGRSVAFTDATTTLNGGDYAYQVVAVRRGGAKAETASTPSSARTAAVPVPPTTTAPAPGSPPVGAGNTTTVKPGSAAGVDLSGFLAARAGVTPSPPPTILEPPDPGFKGNLPFDAPPPGQDLEEGGAQAVPPSTGRSTPVVGLDSARPLVPVAGGLILLLLAVHLRLLNRRLKPVAGADLPIAAREPPEAELPHAELPHAERPEAELPEAELEPRPSPTFYDFSAEERWKSDWAAPAGPLQAWPPQPPPEPELATDLEPEDYEVQEVISPIRRPLVRAGRR